MRQCIENTMPYKAKYLILKSLSHTYKLSSVVYLNNWLRIEPYDTQQASGLLKACPSPSPPEELETREEWVSLGPTDLFMWGPLPLFLRSRAQILLSVNSNAVSNTISPKIYFSFSLSVVPSFSLAFGNMYMCGYVCMHKRETTEKNKVVPANLKKKKKQFSMSCQYKICFCYKCYSWSPFCTF